VVSTFNRTAEKALGTTTHEFYHRAISITNNYKHANPYPDANNKEKKEEFEQIMYNVLVNLYQKLSVNSEPPPSNIEDLSAKLEALSNVGLDEPVRKHYAEIVNKFLIFDKDSGYTKDQKHEEFVVRLPQIIAELGELPPELREAFYPLENYYKTQVNPRFLEYIENHPRKYSLLRTDYDKYHPETILSRSGEDELLAKDLTKLKPQEKILLEQIQQMQSFIKLGDMSSINNLLPKLQDERVIRAALTACIEYDNEQLFENMLKSIKAPQYLGPQLVLATKLNREKMAKVLLPKINNQYYLAKAAEIAFDSNNYPILQASLDGIKDRKFIKRVFEDALKQGFTEEKMECIQALFDVHEALSTKVEIEKSSSSALMDAVFHQPVNYFTQELNRFFPIPERDTSNMQFMSMPLINFDSNDQQKIMSFVETAELKEYFADRRGNYKDFLSYSEAEQHKALNILKTPEFEKIIDKDSYKLESLIRLSEHELSRALNILKTPEFKKIIDNRITYFESFMKLSDDEQNKALNLLKAPELTKVIGNNFGILEMLVKNGSEDRLNLLKTPELQEHFNLNDTFNKRIKLSQFMKLSDDEYNKLLESLKISNLDGDNKKLQSMYDQIQSLYDKKQKEYNKSPNSILLKDINDFKLIQEQAKATLEKLETSRIAGDNYNEQLRDEVKKVYKTLEEAKLSNAKKSVDICRAANTLQSSGVCQQNNFDSAPPINSASKSARNRLN